MAAKALNYYTAPNDSLNKRDVTAVNPINALKERHGRADEKLFFSRAKLGHGIGHKESVDNLKLKLSGSNIVLLSEI